MIKSGDLCVIPVNRHLIDVFTGTGWKNWSRFRLHKRTPLLVAGNGISEEDYRNLKELLKNDK